MSTNIVVEASSVWTFVEQNDLGFCDDILVGQRCLIAENNDYGTKIFAEIDIANNLVIIVEADGDEVFEAIALDEADCFDVVSEIYDTYLTSAIFDTIDNNDDLTQSTREDEIYERDLELLVVIEDFVSLATDYTDTDGDVLDDIMEHTLEYMYRKHGLKIKRPMFLEDENGDEFYTEYPYEVMVFDDDHDLHS